MKVRGRPLGLVLIAALLIMLSLRALVWTLGEWLLGDGLLGTGRVPVYAAVFAASITSAIGLLLLQRWARWLALALCSVYAALLVGGLIAGWMRVGLEGIDLANAVISASRAGPMISRYFSGNNAVANMGKNQIAKANQNTK